MASRSLRTTVLGLALLAGACSSADGTTGTEGTSSGSGTSSGNTSAAGGGTGTGASGTAGSTGSGTAGGTTTTTGGTGGTTTTTTSSTSSSTDGLNPSVPPGLNFDLSLWQLQEPVGQPGAPTTISTAMLEAGYHDMYFFTDPTDGAMTFWDPENGVTTPNSNYPRSELREMTSAGMAANWPIAGTNTLSATVAVVKVPDHVCVGQIHIGDAIQAGLPASTKPLLELYYHSNGDIVLGIEDSPSGNQTSHPITNVPLGTMFSYSIQLTGNGTITLAIDGTPSTFPMPSSFNGYGMYFKAGDYDQTAGSDATVGATVKFYALKVSHGP